MRIVKILLVIVLIAVSALYGFTTVTERLSGTSIGPTLQCDTDTLDVSVTDDESAYLSGVTAHDEQDGDLTSKILVSGLSKMVENDTVKVTYLVFDSDHNVATLTRNLHFADYQSPRISIDEALIYYQNESIALLDRISVNDVFDGDITSLVRVSSLSATSDAETYMVTVQVTNSLGDTARVELPVIQLSSSAVRPTVTLTEYLVYLEKGSTFRSTDYLYSVSNPDGTVGSKSSVEITGSVDTSTAGTYTVRYTYPYDGSSGSAVLTVIVE